MNSRRGEQRLKYLLLEEENPLRDELVTLLQEQHIVVYPASDPTEALHLLRREKIDLMIVAALSPFEQTVQLLEHVRKSQSTKELPLILISNYYRSPSVDQMTQHLHKTLYLVRPFPEGEFLRLIKASIKWLQALCFRQVRGMTMVFNALVLIALVGLAVYLLVFIRLREKKFLEQKLPPPKPPLARKDTKFAKVLAARDSKKSS